MPARERVPCHCLKCRGALVGKSTARQHTAQSGTTAVTVQSFPQWLAQIPQNAASSSGMILNESDEQERREEPAAEMDQDEDEIRPSKRTRVNEDQLERVVGYIFFKFDSENFTYYLYDVNEGTRFGIFWQ